ncbi:hypothetical protein, partial [Rhizobium sp. BK376]|uniref:hypothetical protein n=1 Tax=Rhizobium sp. BK376 TaxID=2512149 RepID=UPI0010ED5A12
RSLDNHRPYPHPYAAARKILLSLNPFRVRLLAAADGVLDFLITLGMLEGADAIRRLKILLDGSRV